MSSCRSCSRSRCPRCRSPLGRWFGEVRWSAIIFQLFFANCYVPLPVAGFLVLDVVVVVGLVVGARTLLTQTSEASRRVDTSLAGYTQLQPDRTLIDVYRNRCAFPWQPSVIIYYL